MSQMSVPATGGCRCAQVRFRLDEAPLMTLACHCTGCQKMTASAFSLTVMVVAAAFTLTAGEPVPGGLHRDDARHWHCPWCMSWTHSTFAPGRDIVNVRATMLDDTAWFAPYVETMATEKLGWVELPVRRSYPAWALPEDFRTLIEEYRAS